MGINIKIVNSKGAWRCVWRLGCGFTSAGVRLPLDVRVGAYEPQPKPKLPRTAMQQLATDEVRALSVKSRCYIKGLLCREIKNLGAI